MSRHSTHSSKQINGKLSTNAPQQEAAVGEAAHSLPQNIFWNGNIGCCKNHTEISEIDIHNVRQM